MTPFGQALTDYYEHDEAPDLVLHNSYGDPEEMPVEVFFRELEDFTELELSALGLCEGKVLDVGAGTGVHSAVLQAEALEVYALELDPAACEIMRAYGIEQVIQDDIYSYHEQKFDTLLLLMNGIGLAKDMKGLSELLDQLKKLLNPGGKIIFDSSDIAYLYDELPKSPYYGEVEFCYEYKGKKGTPFKWLYIDQDSMRDQAKRSGLDFEVVYEDEYDQYLAVLRV